MGVITHFFINQEMIAEQSCENKEIVEMQCNGKCQMAKELVKTETPDENQKSLPDLLRVETEIAAFDYKEITSPFEALPMKIMNNQFENRDYTLSQGFLNEIFHPPFLA
jgi:hypothetical protein